MVLLMIQAAAVADERAIVTLIVNETAYGDALVILRQGDVWLRVQALEAAGLRGFAGRRLVIDGEPHVAAASLAPAVTAVFDEVALTLSLVAAPTLFAATTLTIGDARPADLVYSRTPSAFLNYSGTWQSTTGVSAFGEGGVSLGPVSITSGFSRDAGTGRIVRGLSTATIDSPARLQRWTIGDVVVPGGPLDSGFVGGGITVGREWSLDPYYERFPSPSVSGSVTTPSTVDVYVNDRLVSENQLPPGPFQITKMPLTSGLGTTRVVVRDAFGREQQFGNPYYLTTTLLKRGTQDYQLGFAYARSTDTTSSASYQQPAAFAREEFGITDWLTAGVRAQGDQLTQTGTAVISMRVWRLGAVELAAAASRFDHQTSPAGRVAYAIVTPHITLSAVAQVFAPTYATLTAPPTGQTVSLLAATIGVPLGRRLSASLQYTDDRSANVDENGLSRHERATLATSWHLGGPFDLYTTVTAVRDPGWPRRIDAFGGLTVLLGQRTSVNMTREMTGPHVYSAVEAQRSVPIGTGFGFRLRGANIDDLGTTNTGSGTLTYQAPFGRYEVIRNVDPAFGTSATLAGGVVVIGGRPYFTRAVSSSYALVDVPGVPNVRVYSNNQEVGRTGRSGALLVPDLLAYQGNRLSIADGDLPIDFAIETTARTVAPPFRGGGLAFFPAFRVRTVSGRVVVSRKGEWLPPAFGEMTIQAGIRRLVSPIGTDGEFYFENLPTGALTATVMFTDGACAVALTIDTDKPFSELGTLRCDDTSQAGEVTR